MFNRKRFTRALAVTATATVALAAFGALPASAAGGDDFVGAQLLPSATDSTSGNNSGATAEVGEPQHNPGHAARQSEWFRWIAPVTGKVIFQTRGSSFDTVMAAYTGNTLTALTQIATNDDFVFFDGTFVQSRIVFNATAGTEYKIAVDSFNSAHGAFKLTWSTNDDFAAAQTLPGPVGDFQTVFGDTTSGSKQAGEPNHAGRVGGSSSWYKWMAPFTGQANFTTLNSKMDTVLAVYTGNSVNALTQVVANDNFGGTKTSDVVFNAKKGTTYRIAVDGIDNTQQGGFILRYAEKAADIRISDAQVAEGNAGGKLMLFGVSLSKATDVPITVTASTKNGTAGEEDYAARLNVLVTIPAGQTGAFFGVAIKGDTVKEPNETFTVQLSKPTGGNAKIADGLGTGTITNDD